MLTVNGKVYETKSELMLNELLEQLALLHQPCAVEVNQKLVPFKDRELHKLHEGDNVEIVTLVGGG